MQDAHIFTCVDTGLSIADKSAHLQSLPMVQHSLYQVEFHDSLDHVTLKTYKFTHNNHDT